MRRVLRPWMLLPMVGMQPYSSSCSRIRDEAPSRSFSRPERFPLCMCALHLQSSRRRCSRICVLAEPLRQGRLAAAAEALAAGSTAPRLGLQGLHFPAYRARLDGDASGASGSVECVRGNQCFFLLLSLLHVIFFSLRGPRKPVSE